VRYPGKKSQLQDALTEGQKRTVETMGVAPERRQECLLERAGVSGPSDLLEEDPLEQELFVGARRCGVGWTGSCEVERKAPRRCAWKSVEVH